MDKKYLDKMQEKLLALKAEMVEHLMAENEDFNQLVQDMDPKDLVDIAADDMGRRTLEALSSQDLKRINLIDSALSRLKNDKYGVCIECGQAITKQRLDAIPYALKCISCQSLSEKRR